VDILTNEFEKFQSILHQVAREAGYHVWVLGHYDIWVEFYLLKDSSEKLAFLEIDVAWDIRWKGIPLVPRDFLEKHRMRRERVYTLKPGAEAAVTLTKGLFLKGTVREKYKQSLPGMVQEDESSFVTALSDSLGESLAHKLAKLTAQGNWKEAVALAPKLRQEAIGRALSANPWAQIGREAAFLFWGIRKFFRPGGLFVVLIGPDGSGKSTVARGLQQSLETLFHGSKSYHAHFRFLPRLRDLMGLLRLKRPNEPTETVVAANREIPAANIGRFRSMVYLMYYTLDYLLGFPVIFYNRGRGVLIIFDRYFYDYLIQSGLSLPHYFLTLVMRMIPKPDMVVYLKNSPDVILSRKPELTRQELERQGAVCAQLISRLPQGQVVETTGTPEETTAKVTKILMAKICGQE
jgi:thymidylate kinase